MGEIINLRRVRKAAARDAAAGAASTNRALHGASKLDKARARSETLRREALLDGAALDPLTKPADGAE